MVGVTVSHALPGGQGMGVHSMGMEIRAWVARMTIEGCVCVFVCVCVCVCLCVCVPYTIMLILSD